MTLPNDGHQNGQPEAQQQSTPASNDRHRAAKPTPRAAASPLAKQVVEQQFSELVAQNFPEEPLIRGRVPVPLIPLDATTAEARRFGPRDWPASDDVVALEDAETHFTPPRPSSQLGGHSDPVRFWAMVGAMLGSAGAIVALVFRAALGPSSAITGLLAFLALLFVASLFILLAKMPAYRNSNMPDDDGAVV